MSGTADSNDGLPPASDWRAPSLPEWLRSREVELQEAIFAQVRTVEPDAVTDGDPQLEGGLRETIAACIACGLASIERGTSWSGPFPSVVADHACHAAAGGMSLTTALGWLGDSCSARLLAAIFSTSRSWCCYSRHRLRWSRCTRTCRPRSSRRTPVRSSAKRVRRSSAAPRSCISCSLADHRMRITGCQRACRARLRA